MLINCNNYGDFALDDLGLFVVFFFINKFYFIYYYFFMWICMFYWASFVFFSE